MKKLKIGLIGLGQRGSGLLKDILKIETAAVTAVCDLFPDRIEGAAALVSEHGDAEPLKTADYREAVDSGVDLVIVATGWSVHVAVALYAMEAGIPVGMEVGGTHSIDDCWKLVDCYERTRTPFMFLENCCYNRDEALVTSLTRNGVLGEISYCSGSYGHDLREEIAGGIDTHHYRLEEYKNHNCENYPTHELVPIAKILGINRGNRFVKVVSMSSKARGMKAYIEKTEKYAERLKDAEFRQGDVTTTMIECENGETILLKLDTTLPRLYDRALTVSGTKGFYCQSTQAVVLDDGKFDHERDEYAKAFGSAKEYERYLPADWTNVSEEQRDAGHGGMDFVMLKHFFDDVANGREMAIDVYDAVSSMSITALSEQSIANGSIPVACPDFTRGAYKTRTPLDALNYPELKSTEESK